MMEKNDIQNIQEVLSEFVISIKQQISELKEMNSSEVVTINDDRNGFRLELQSRNHDVKSLIDMGMKARHFVLKNDTKKLPSGVG